MVPGSTSHRVLYRNQSTGDRGSKYEREMCETFRKTYRRKSLVFRVKLGVLGHDNKSTIHKSKISVIRAHQNAQILVHESLF